MNEQDNTDKKEQTPDGASKASVSNSHAIDAAFAALDDATPDQTPSQTPEEDHRKAVNDGRLKKASEDLRAAQEENARLRKQLEELTAKKTDLEELRKIEGASAFDDESLKFFGRALDQVREDVSKQSAAQIADARRASDAVLVATQTQRKRETWDAATAAVEQTHAGLVRRIAPDGDLNAAWNRYLDSVDDFGRTRRSLLNGACSTGRLAGAKRVFEKFVEESGISGQAQIETGAPRSAAPAVPAGTDAGGKKVYPSKDAIEQEIARIAGSYRKGLMDRKSYDERSAELEDAMRSGRYVKQQ